MSISVHLNLGKDLLRNLIFVHIHLQSPAYRRTGRRRDVTRCPLLPLPEESCPHALPQAAAGSVFFEFMAAHPTDPTTDPAAHPGVWLKLGGDPCWEEFHHVQAAGTRATGSVGAPQCHQKPSRPYMGKLPEKRGKTFAAGMTQGFGILHSQIFISVFL